jgi:hypothetical protein
MTRYVLLAGGLFAASFTLVWLVSAVVFPLNNDRTPFSGTGAAFEIWLVCVLVAVVSDAFVKPAARAAVTAFATSLTPEAGPHDREVKQNSGWDAEIRTTTSGSFEGRRTTVLLCQRPRLSFLTVEMGCRVRWVLDIRRRSLASEALASVGSPIQTGDEPLDEAIVVQGDDETAIHAWVRAARVKPKILSLFQVCGITSLTTVTGREGEPVMRAHYGRFKPRLFPLPHAACILNDLAGLATSAEAADIQERKTPAS